MPDSNTQASNVGTLDANDKLPLDEAMARVRGLLLSVKDDLYKITEITQCDLTDDDREAMNDYLENAFGDWQAEVQGSLEEVAYVFGEAASTCYFAWRKRYSAWRKLSFAWRKSMDANQMHIGLVLPNGGTVVDFTVDNLGHGTGGVVLCTAHGLSADPFVTWNWWISTEGVINCSTGHYFDRLQPAVADFDKRRGRK